MNVKFYATLRQVVGGKQIAVELPEGSTLRQLIAELVKRYPGLEREMLDPQGNLNGHIHIYVNGRDSVFLENLLDTVLKPEDLLSIFPPVGGG